jgi:hypothetical protein
MASFQTLSLRKKDVYGGRMDRYREINAKAYTSIGPKISLKYNSSSIPYLHKNRRNNNSVLLASLNHPTTLISKSIAEKSTLVG